MQDIRELGLGWAWFVNDLRGFLPAWQDMELASLHPDEPVTEVEADVPIAPILCKQSVLTWGLIYTYERPLAVSTFGTPEHVPDWNDTHAMALCTRPQSPLSKWIRTDLGAEQTSLEIYAPILSLNRWTVKLDPTCPCTVVVFLAVDLLRDQRH